MDPTFKLDPPLDGSVHCFHRAPDGGFYLGGEFTAPNPFLVKYNSNGTWDSDFIPALDGAVLAIDVLFSEGLVIAGGEFRTFGGEESRGLVGMTLRGQKFSGDLGPGYERGLDFIFGAGFNGTVRAVKLLSSQAADFLVGGDFTSFRNQPARFLALFRPVDYWIDSTSLGRSFDPPGPVNTVVRSAGNGPYFAGGNFRFPGENQSRGIVSLDLSRGTISRTFNVDGTVGTMIPKRVTGASSLLLAGGQMTTGRDLVGMDLDLPSPGTAIAVEYGGGDPQYAADFPFTTAFLEDQEGQVLTGNRDGDLWRFSIGPPPWNSPAYTINTDYLHRELANGPINLIEQTSDGLYYVAGSFTEVDGVVRPHFARLYGPQGSSPPSGPAIRELTVTDDRVAVQIPSLRYASDYQLSIRPDGSTLWRLSDVSNVSNQTTLFAHGLRPNQAYQVRARARNTNGWGDFGETKSFVSLPPRGEEGLPIHHQFAPEWTFSSDQVATLGRDGTFFFVGRGSTEGQGILSLSPGLEPSLFYPFAQHPVITALRPLPNGGVMALIGLTRFDRIPARGQVDETFQSALVPSSSSDFDFLVQGDGKLIMTNAQNPDTNEVFPLARLNQDGSHDSDFSPQFDLAPKRLLSLPDVSLVALGYFNEVEGVPSDGIVKLTPAGDLDPNFDTTPLDESLGDFDDAAVDSNGRILLSGRFREFSGSPTVHLVRLNTDGTIDETFPDVSLSRNDDLLIAVQSDEAILLANRFKNEFELNQKQVRAVVRLSPEGDLDTSYQSGLGIAGTGSINDLFILADDSAVLVGTFYHVNGLPKSRLAILRGPSPTPAFEIWLSSYGLSADLDSSSDLDGDGFSLGQEFAYHLSPLRPDTQPLVQPAPGGAMVVPPLERSVLVTGESSSNLSRWSHAPFTADWFLRLPGGSEERRHYFRSSTSLSK